MGQQSGSDMENEATSACSAPFPSPTGRGQPCFPAAFPSPFPPQQLYKRDKKPSGRAQVRYGVPSAAPRGCQSCALSLQPGGPPWRSYPKAAPRVGPGAQGATWALWERRELAVGLGEVILSGSEDGTVLSPRGITRNRHCTSPWGRQGMLCAGGQSHSKEERTPNP